MTRQEAAIDDFVFALRTAEMMLAGCTGPVPKAVKVMVAAVLTKHAEIAIDADARSSRWPATTAEGWEPARSVGGGRISRS